jgi:hypothetical protein
MDQRSIVLDFARKGFTAMVIHKELVATLGAEAVNSPSVIGYLHEAKFSPSIHPAPFSEPHPAPNDSHNAIPLALAAQSFASIRHLARLTHLLRSTIHRWLTQSLLFRVRHLRWVPHDLLAAQKLSRVIHSRDLLRVLERQRSRSSGFTRRRITNFAI